MHSDHELISAQELEELGEFVLLEELEELRQAEARAEPKLTDDQAFLCQIINRLSTGGHPYADARTLSYFAKPYVKRLLNRAIKSKLSAQGIVQAERIKAHLDEIMSKPE